LTKRPRLILDVGIIVAYSVFLFVILCAPNVRPPGFLDFPYSDKLIHACQFAILAFLICRFFLRHSAEIRRSWIFIASVSITASYGAVTELIQKAVPGRVADVGDVAADTVGALLAASIWLFLETSRKRSQSAPQKVAGSQKEEV
jgi:VanZ family protein